MFSIKTFKKLCSESWFKEFEANRKLIQVQQGDNIFTEGDEVKGIYFIEKGKVKVCTKINDEIQQIVRLAGDGMILGHRGINSKKFPVSATALTECILSYLPKKTFIEILKENPAMSIHLINFMSQELRESEERVKNLNILDPKLRIAIIIIKLADTFGYKSDKSKLLEFTLSRKDLANMAGTTYETTIRSLSALNKENYITLIKKEIAISNEPGLRKLIAAYSN